MSPITEHAKLDYLGDGRWRVREDLAYTHPEFGEIVVPEGFENDLDSVPRIPLAYWLTKNASVDGAVIHDWLYQAGKIGDRSITRSEADRIFLDVMKDEGIWWWRRRLIWLGVRAGGWRPWNQYREAEEDQPDFV